MSTTLDTNKRT